MFLLSRVPKSHSQYSSGQFRQFIKTAVWTPSSPKALMLCCCHTPWVSRAAHLHLSLLFSCFSLTQKPFSPLVFWETQSPLPSSIKYCFSFFFFLFYHPGSHQTHRDPCTVAPVSTSQGRTGYIIFGVSCKMKMQGSLFNKAEKRAKVLKYKAFSSFHSLSEYHDVFNWLFNVILSKCKFKILSYLHDSYHSPLYYAMPV